VVENVLAMLEPEGVGLQVQGRSYPLRATPQAVGVPEVWLLGSSDYSARLAAAKGLPYVFAHHFSGEGTAQIIGLYRSGFRPSDLLSAPRTFLTVNVAVAPTQEEAERLARPQLLAMVALRTGGELRAQMSVEEAERTVLAESHVALLDQMRSRWVIGTPETARDQLTELAARYDVDEVMIHPVAGATESDPLDRAPTRESTLRLLAEALV
jgi:luciferase family oxidoreductase group 1